ncbi:MAG: aminotransferase class V-fold PLP-dependent enzyme, partial [Bacillota bacterium]
SPAPKPVTQAFFDAYQSWHERGAGLAKHYEAMRDSVTDEVRAKLARFLGCDPDELAFTANCTEGMNIVASGLAWQAGDEVIITDQEHPANSFFWMYHHERLGVKVRILELCHDHEELLVRFRKLLNPRTRLVAISHVTTTNGHILPIWEMVEATHQNGSLILVDGAHAVGQIPVNLHELRCDFYAMNGHKWLMGPAGTGAVFIRRDRLDLVSPVWVGDVKGHKFRYAEDGSLVLPHEARRHEFATRNWALIVGLGRAIDYVEEIGVDLIRSRVRMLADRLKQRLREVPGMKLLSPWDPDHSMGLVTFEVEGHPGPQLYAQLEARGICPRYLFNAIRVSIGYYTLQEELDAMVDAIKEIVKE